MLEVINYYEVIAKCGHVGRNHYVPIKFAVKAETGEEAAKLVREYPRVKHNHKDAILKVTKIDYEKFLEINETNNKDPYLKCSSKQEQNQIEGFELRLVIDNHNFKEEPNKQARKERVVHKIKKMRLIEQLCWEDDEYDYVY